MSSVDTTQNPLSQRIRPLFRVGLVTLLSGIFVLTTACNTIEGAGEDIEAGGDAIEDAADDGD